MSALAKLLKSPQLGRVVRLVVFTLAGAAASVPLLGAWEARYPAIGAIVGVLEALYRTAVPTQPAPKVTAVLADPTTTTDPAPPTAKG
jgi:hypothetical protein